MKKIPKILVVCLAVFVVVSLVLRGVLFSMPYEYDELFTAVSTDPTFAFSWLYHHYLLIDVHPPLYNLLLWGWNHWVHFGPELYLRLPSLFMGVAALLIAWVDFPKRFGTLARSVFVALLSCNLYIIMYSQHARSYMLVLLFAVPLTFLFTEISLLIRTRQSITVHEWGRFAVVSVLLCWSHYFGALLFGCFSVLLLAQAVYYKRNLKWFVLVPSIVFILFLPWLIPNFIAQLHYERFAGNWWGNVAPWRLIHWALIYAAFSTFWPAWTLGLIMLGWGMIRLGVRLKQKKSCPFVREILLLGLVLILALGCVALISLKTFLFFGRYFIAFLPGFYLLLTLLLLPMLRRGIVIPVLLVGFLSTNLIFFAIAHRELVKTPKIPSRIISQIFRDTYPDKEMFVVALEGFPPPAMPAMYGFYINRVYGLNRPVVELISLDEATRNEVLKRKDNAFIWMPNCTKKKLQQASDKIHRSVGVYGRVSNACILRIFK